MSLLWLLPVLSTLPQREPSMPLLPLSSPLPLPSPLLPRTLLLLLLPPDPLTVLLDSLTVPLL